MIIFEIIRLIIFVTVLIVFVINLLKIRKGLITLGMYVSLILTETHNSYTLKGHAALEELKEEYCMDGVDDYHNLNKYV